MQVSKSLHNFCLFALLALGVCVFVMHQRNTPTTAATVSNSLDASNTNFHFAARVNLDPSESPTNRQSYPEGYQRNASFDYRAAMNQLNDARVPQDDPRLIQLIRDYYLVPPSKESYNLKYPERKIHSRGQASFVDSRFNFMEWGFYVEADALTGEVNSNSLFFEKVRKWNGLLVEPDPSNFAALLKKHRKAYAINACLNTKPYPSTVTFNKAYNMGRVVHGKSVKNWLLAQGIKKNEIQIQCFPLYSILLALNQFTVDYFSLDVEGDELGVLKTIPMDKVNVKMLSVEFVNISTGDYNSYMKSKGYVNLLQMSRFDGVNDIMFFRKQSDDEFF